MRAMQRRAAARIRPQQIVLPWPGTDEVCPRCHGLRQVYHRATPNGVEILGGKRMPCPVCQGVGTVRTPRQPGTGSAPAASGAAAAIGRTWIGVKSPS